MRHLLCCISIAVFLTGCEKPAAAPPKTTPKTSTAVASANSGSSGVTTTEKTSTESATAKAVKGVYPSEETVRGGAYTPLSRPLYIYVNTARLKERPQVAAYAAAMVNVSQETLSNVFFVGLNDADAAASREELKKAIGDAPAAENLTGDVVVDGSSTVYPLSVAVAEEFGEANKDVNVTVGKSGTGGGFKRFSKGETDISGASRPISESEKKLCAENNIEYVAFKVALDGLSVVAHPSNNWCDELSVEQLNAIWKDGSTVKKWSDIDPTWPAEEIKLYGADADSGTFDFFTEVINGKAKSTRKDYTASGEDNILVQGIAGDKNSLGYIPYGYFVSKKSGLKLLAVIPAGASGAAAAEKAAAEKATEPKAP